MEGLKRSGPLQDITIIDCTQALSGPFGTALLADLGANVIKIEPPQGDSFRPLPPFLPDYAHASGPDQAGMDYGAPFAAVNRNKRSISLDFKSDDDRQVLLQLCEKADAIVENMRSGVMDRLGLGYEVISKRNPAIVYGAVRGFGDPRTGTSPYAEWPCLDVAAQAMGGLVDANDDLVSPAVADVYPGTLMALGLVAAIHHARLSGRGQFFDVAMYDSVFTLMRTNVAAYGFTNYVAKKKVAKKVTKNAPRKNSRATSLVPFGLFPTKDGKVAIAAPQPNHWRNLCDAMARPDLVTDERTRSNGARVRNQEYAEQQISQWTGSISKQEVFEALGGKVPVGPAQNMEEIFRDPHISARNMVDKFRPPGDNPEVAIGGNPMKFSNTTTGFYQAPPLFDEHRDEVFDEFGITRPEDFNS
ncbi:MAG: CoA transferase [bacterium]|nr:CoA transferase [Gammaproteobacteria bacterium]